MKLSIRLNRRSQIPLNRQLYEELTRLILEGVLDPGAKIPSSRDLAEELGVSRPTVNACLEQLAQEGYLETKRGSGSYVSQKLKKESIDRARNKTAQRPRSKQPVYTGEISDYGKFVSKLPAIASPEEEPELSFYCWRPALDQFPTTEWARILGRHTRSAEPSKLDFSFDPQGTLDLRRALAGLVKRHRAVNCHPDQIIPVMGLNQGIDLATRLHLNAGCRVVVEEPAFTPLAFKAAGCEIVPVPVDEDGLRVEKLPASKTGRDKVDLAILTPAHQFPTGAVMPLGRRLEFLQWAHDCQVLVLEDDYDSEYQSSGQPIPALMSLDKDQRVIYLGTLNQLMFPALGFGYLIVPPRLVPLYRQARKLAGEQISIQMQDAITEFIDDGHLDRHVRRLRTLYRGRRTHLVKALKRSFGERVSIGPATRGVFVLVRINVGMTDNEIIERATNAGVGLTSTRQFYQKRSPAHEFIMGFGDLDEKRIDEGVRRLALALR